MPSVKTPDGRTLKFPEGTPPEQVMAVLQAQYPDAFQAPAPAPAAPPAAPTPPPAAAAPPPGAAPTPPATGIPTPPPAAPPGAPGAPMIAGSTDPTEGMSAMERFLAGAGQSVDSTGRGIRQVWNAATGDAEELKQLQAAEAEQRKLDEALLSTRAGRLGQIGGHVAQAAVPVGAGAKATTGLAKVGLASALGGAQGALAPTVEGESRGRNATIGAAIGAVLPVAGRAAGVVNEAKAGAIRALSRAMSNNGTKAASVREAAGKRMARLVADVRVPVDRIAKEASAVARDYGTALPKHVRGYINQIQQMSGTGAKITGSKLQETRSALIREADNLQGAGKSGVERLRRVIDDATDDAIEAMPKTIRDRLVGSRVSRLREARRTYKTGQEPETLKPYSRAAQRGAIEALRRPEPEEEN